MLEVLSGEVVESLGSGGLAGSPKLLGVDLEGSSPTLVSAASWLLVGEKLPPPQADLSCRYGGHYPLNCEPQLNPASLRLPLSVSGHSTERS